MYHIGLSVKMTKGILSTDVDKSQTALLRSLTMMRSTEMEQLLRKPHHEKNLRMLSHCSGEGKQKGKE